MKINWRERYNKDINLLSDLARDIHSLNRSKGFYDIDEEISCLEGKENNLMELGVSSNFVSKIKLLNTITRLCLVNTEVSEAVESIRSENFKDYNSKHIPEFLGIEEELADVIIRVLDISHNYKIRLADAIIAKLEFNQNREFMHGKKV